MTVLLHRWHTPTLTQTITLLKTTCFGCARCGGLIPAHLAERDYTTGEWVHAGNCPYAAQITFPAEPVAPQKSRAQEVREEQAARQKELRRIKSVAVARATPTPPAPPAPTPEQVRWVHDDARRRALERQRDAEEAAATDARRAG